MKPGGLLGRFTQNAFAQPALGLCAGPLCLLVLSDNAA